MSDYNQGPTGQGSWTGNDAGRDGAEQQPPWPPQQAPVGPGGPGGAGQHDKRPGTVVAACVITWVSSAIGLIGGIGLTLLFLLVSEDDLADEIAKDEDMTELLDLLNWSASDFVDAMVAVGIAMAVFSLLAIIFAAMAFARNKVGRILLTVLGVVAAVVSVISFMFPATAVIVLAVVLLFVGGANDWYARRASPARY